ncbi:MAG: DUF3644 domain-containing protein [Bacteroidetes bacterium]|nr:DUF3644 domain-containing protein [Bacteroidota bacterium]
MEKKSYKIAEKSLNAVLAALEIYNKPDFKYRDESFSILMINAFELLFKAKMLKENNEKIKYLYIYSNEENNKLTSKKLK